ncbi:hypothetical protein DITRI_Ditri01bG0181900 [Diplodiscus trichospermus]
MEKQKKTHSSAETSSSLGDTAAFHGILSFSILVFIPFLLLRYQKAYVSPFDDNSTMILAFVIATLTYIAAMATEFKLRIRDVECPNIITNTSQLSAPLASITLLMIIFPYLGLFLLLIWVGFFVKLAIDSYQELFQLVGDAARCASELIRKKNMETKKEEKIDDQPCAASSTTCDSPV